MLNTSPLSSPSESAVAATGQATASSETRLLLSATIQSTAHFSVSVKDKPLPLVHHAAVARINELLAPAYGNDAIQNATEMGVDTGPTATADRIVALSTGFFGAYRAGKPDMSDEQALQSFMEVIGKGIEQGFAEAREILSGLQVLNGQVAADIDQTYDLVQQGLADFAAQVGATA